MEHMPQAVPFIWIYCLQRSWVLFCALLCGSLLGKFLLLSFAGGLAGPGFGPLKQLISGRKCKSRLHFGYLSKITCSYQLHSEIRRQLAACVLSLNWFLTHEGEKVPFVGPATTPELEQVVG